MASEMVMAMVTIISMWMVGDTDMDMALVMVVGRLDMAAVTALVMAIKFIF